MVFAEAQPRAAASAAKESVRERLGRVLDRRFRLEACIGSGGTGAVYRARVLYPGADLPSLVAVKVLHPHLVADEGRREVFLKEARISALVGHPGAVRVYDARVTDDGTAYLVLEYLEGRSLQEALVGWGDLLVEEVVRVTKGILAILASAHDHGVVHCDIKPENVFVLADGKVKLLDFGIARIAGGARTGVAGTAAFMAPEQARGEWSRVDARADVWSVGATFTMLVTGSTVPARSAEVLFADVPGPIADVIHCALSENPAHRWANARLMLDALIQAASRSGLPRSSRSMITLDDDDDDDPMNASARPRETDESTEPFMLVVPPYPVLLDALTSTPLPRITLPPAAPSPVPEANTAKTRARKQFLVAAAVVAAAGFVGAALALASASNIEGDTRARVLRPAAAVQVTAGEVRR